MAKVCIEYECEVQESQRKPENLLDALEQGDHTSEEDNDSSVGEDKVASFLSHGLSVLSLVLVKRESMEKMQVHTTTKENAVNVC